MKIIVTIGFVLLVSAYAYYFSYKEIRENRECVSVDIPVGLKAKISWCSEEVKERWKS